MPKPEQFAREKIDAALAAAGWAVLLENIRSHSGTRTEKCISFRIVLGISVSFARLLGEAF
jgi:hypothetical protein